MSNPADVSVPIADGLSRPPEVLLHQLCVPHYRKRLFELLSANQHIKFTIVSDVRPDAPFLEVVRMEEAAIRHRLATAYSFELPGALRLSWQPALIPSMLRHRPDVVIAQGSPYVVTTWVLLALGRILSIPVLLWTHGLQGEESGIKWQVRRLMYRLASGLLLYGDHAKRLLSEKGFDPDRLYVLYNSLDFEVQKAVASTIAEREVAAYRKSLGLGLEDRLVIFTGRLQPVKRLPLLLEAIAHLCGRGLRVHLVLVGDGHDRNPLAVRAEQLGITELVHFAGAVYEEGALATALMASDLAVIPAGAGLSIMHAFAYGTPVLLHDRVEEHFPEWEAVTEGITGFYYRHGDMEHLAVKIEEALFPHPKKAKMAMACREVIENRYNPRRHAEAMMEAVESVRARATHRDQNPRVARSCPKVGS